MAQRVFVNVVGFSDVERHALNSLFRLSEGQETIYSLWEPHAPDAAKLSLIDGQSYEARLEIESPRNAEIPIIWVGTAPPPNALRSFARPISWSEVVQAMDELVGPMSEPIDFDVDFDDVDTQPPDTQPPELPPQRKALIVNASLDERLYLRAKLALAQLPHADEAATVAQALELARDNDYVLAVVDFDLPDGDGWQLMKDLAGGARPVANVIVMKQRASLAERVRGWFAGALGFFDKPPHPAKLHELLLKV